MVSIKNMWYSFKGFVGECRRVLRVTKKPDSEELKTIIKASALGMAVIGLLGFTIAMANQLLFGGGF